MEVIRIPRIAQDTCWKHHMKGRSIGFVPTMGALHEGHLSLIRRSKSENDITVASIFVNPLQFGPAEDFGRYPRPVEEDIRRLREEEIDLLLLPDPAAMYPEEFVTRISVGSLGEKLCGAFRPGHFDGVATVVCKLFAIVRPTRAYFGQKDFQQTVIIRRVNRDLNLTVDVVVCPTIREADGLAMSSRNAYLDPAGRAAAAALIAALSRAAETISRGERNAETARSLLRGRLEEERLIRSIEYASVYDPETLEEVGQIKGDVLLAVAVRIGDTRLIDNVVARPSRQNG